MLTRPGTTWRQRQEKRCAGNMSGMRSATFAFPSKMIAGLELPTRGTHDSPGVPVTSRHSGAISVDKAVEL